uniref:Endonuclease/exonuclease/phosphatase domain-containing protein n=1 Tax=Fundulus heteroclitus TaxID=8078 RepID=A0A3Q2PCK9_FUNHE
CLYSAWKYLCTHDEECFGSFLEKIADMDCSNILIVGDFNCRLFPIDRNLPHHTQSRTKSVILNTIDTFDLLDNWRHPSTKNYTFYSHPHLSSTRINNILSLENKSKHLRAIK